MVTVNDYLASRDAGWMAQIYNFLGMTVGCIVHGLEDAERREQYACDITYGTNNEFGFDYLRDNMKHHLTDMAQRGHYFSIVDEVDSILVDEARTPLIISGAVDDKSELYVAVDKIIPKLVDEDVELDEKQRTATLTEQGNDHIEELLREADLLKGETFYDIENVSVVHHVNQAIKAHKLFQRDRDYIVKNDAGGDHRRVHRPHDGGQALVRRPAPGGRSQGRLHHPAGKPDPGLGHLPELFPAL